MPERASEHFSLSELTAALLEEGGIDAGGRDHLNGCRRCTTLLVRAQLLAQEIEITRRSTPSAQSVATYLALDPGHNRTSPLASLKESLESVLLFLQSDSRSQRTALGLRGAETGGYRLLYSADTLDVDLLLAPAVGAWRVDGEVLALGEEEETDSFLIQLVRTTDHLDTIDSEATTLQSEYLTQSDADGRFRFETVSSGNYDLILTPVEGPLYQISSLELL